MNVELLEYRPSPYIPYFTFAIEGISSVCAHQLARHKVTSFSQELQKYVNMDGFEYETPKSIEWSNETVVNMVYDDDAEGFNVKSKRMCDAYDKIMHDIAFLYREMVKAGIPEEDARYILPNACCVNVTVTMSAYELCDFLSYRYRMGAKWELWRVAEMMCKLAHEVEPDIS